MEGPVSPTSRDRPVESKSAVSAVPALPTAPARMQLPVAIQEILDTYAEFITGKVFLNNRVAQFTFGLAVTGLVSTVWSRSFAPLVLLAPAFIAWTRKHNAIAQELRAKSAVDNMEYNRLIGVPISAPDWYKRGKLCQVNKRPCFVIATSYDAPIDDPLFRSLVSNASSKKYQVFVDRLRDDAVDTVLGNAQISTHHANSLTGCADSQAERLAHCLQAYDYTDSVHRRQWALDLFRGENKVWLRTERALGDAPTTQQVLYSCKEAVMKNEPAVEVDAKAWRLAVSAVTQTLTDDLRAQNKLGDIAYLKIKELLESQASAPKVASIAILAEVLGNTLRTKSLELEDKGAMVVLAHESVAKALGYFLNPT